MLGRSNRGIARELKEAEEVIDKGTVNGYMKTVERNGLELGWLLTKENIDDRYNRSALILASQLPVTILPSIAT